MEDWLVRCWRVDFEMIFGNNMYIKMKSNVILEVSVVWLKTSSILVSNVGSIIRPHER